MSTNPLLAGLPPVHPGAVLREDVLPALGKSKTEIANLLGVSRQTLYDVLREKQPVTMDLACLIGKLTGSNPEFWFRMQVAYDLRHATERMAERVARVPTLTAVEASA